ncbi:hypothetical protein [Pseudomonas putida]|uniref:hypothetical protein n=1 Tax=Pseudomonas putida TaxID=303 RepID=UPI0000EBAA91|nr:hypothetical protein [Pseudomonas putida]
MALKPSRQAAHNDIALDKINGIGLVIMGKLQFLDRQLGRRSFLRNGMLLGAGVAVFGTGPRVVRKTAQQGGFVLINGWVLPSEYFKDSGA